LRRDRALDQIAGMEIRACSCFWRHGV
jgi:hypothetical protein